ncbi:hypothetical protein [uncultured Clostridium sp.]|jgi:hypothetical protein|uniref:hypothetical protein n=1 Tax=uncultured Clostridium sp. TaxID=59620 RepID=UPI0025E895D8|nr:hypothetical protein [uncultured Clostridium sp.]
MMKKKILSLCMVAIMLNISVESYAYSLNNIQLATNSDSTSTPSEGGGPSSGGGEAEQPPSAQPDGGNGESSAQPPNSDGGSTGAGGAGSSTTTPNTPLPNKGGKNNVELEGGIGEWGPNKDNSLPNFNETTGSEKLDVDNKPEEGQYFTISATVPLKMEFLIQNRNENGLSSEGKFITPYYKVTNNGSHKLKVHFESFEYANSKTTKTSDLVKEDLAPLYVVSQPQKNNGKVEMKLNLTYDRPSNSYLKRIDLIPTNLPTITSRLLKSSNSVEQELGELDPNEQARLYYGSDLWESPKSEGINKGVEANFNLKLAFSIEGKTTENNQPSGSTPDTSPSQPPSTPTPSQPSNGTTSGDTSQSSQGSSTQGQQPNGDTSSEAQNPAGNGQQGQRN